MTALIGVLLAVLAPGNTAAAPWTWSLYESATTVTLANEAPDTNLLGPVLECGVGSGQVKLTVNGEDPAKPAERVSLTFAARDPAFQAFITTGKLTVKDETRTASVSAPATEKEKLARFGKLCGP